MIRRPCTCRPYHPDVEIARRTSRPRPRAAETRRAGPKWVEYELGNNPDPAPVRFTEKGSEIGQRAVEG